ncbi:MAG: branched-chain amino acid ABC transporter permease [Deltaproteobacteria bacterium]|nr:branched-chain amino acid ABC transporter permease [Deltaproteobacteria bacterium]
MIDYVVYVLLPQMLHGLVWGTVIAFIALGLTIIFGLMDIVNFAHGEFYMLGAFFGYSLLFVIPNFWGALLVAAIAVGLLGLLIEIFMFRRLYGRDPIFHLLLTFGLGMMFREAATLIWGGETRRVDVPITNTIDVLGMTYPVYRLLILVIGIVVLIAIWYVLSKTETGAMIRAASQDRLMSAALGIRVSLVYTLVFACGAGLAGFSGVLMSPIYFVYPTMGIDAILRAFIVVIVGGMGSLMGALVASIMIGEVESLASLWISPTWAETLVFIALILTMILKPSGLFGKAER